MRQPTLIKTILQLSLISASPSETGFQIHGQNHPANSKIQISCSSPAEAIEGEGSGFHFHSHVAFCSFSCLIPLSFTRTESSDGEFVSQLPPNPLLPKITMVGISTGEGGQVSRASLKKTIEDLTKDLEQTGQRQTQQSKDKDPLFVANVGDFSGMTKTS